MMGNLDVKGRIHSFESFGTVDGPGIRYVIFLQGCCLQCKYCHNRDTWSIMGGKEYTVREVLDRILKYQNYFSENGGGVTVSGGEPLLQADFLIALFQELKKYNIHLTIDTSGNVLLTDRIKELIDLTNLFLLDIKCINDEKAIWLTGVSNQKELEFARYLSSIEKPMWIRQVLVPGITDDENDLAKLKEFIDSLSSVKKVEILPYHDVGKFKWKELGYSYELENILLPTDEDIRKAKKILNI